jgi:two-component system nitrogen regulation sensor histidine kinase NtrY
MKQDAVPPAAEGDSVTAVTDRRALFALPGLFLPGARFSVPH